MRTNRTLALQIITMKTGKPLQRKIGTTALKSRWTSTLVIAAILSMILVGSSHEALAQSSPPSGTIAGHVIQNTADAPMPEGLEVVLTVADVDGAVLEEISAPVPSDGAFAFPDTELNGVDVFTLYLEYGGIARTVEIETEEDTSDIKINIWEKTTSLKDITVTLQSTAIELLPNEENVIGVLELIIVRNSSDRTFLLGADALVLQMPRFGLPNSFRQLSVESDLPSGSIWNGENDFAISNAIPPGDYQIMVNYLVDFEGDTADFTIPVPLGAEIARFLVPPSIGRVVSPDLLRDGSTDFGGQEYAVYNGFDFPKGAEMTITVADLQGPASENSEGFDWVTTGIPAIIGLAGVLILVYAGFIRKRGDDEDEDYDDSGDERADLIADIAKLDDRHESGEINDVEHDSQRSALIERVAEIAGESGSTQKSPKSDSDAADVASETRADIIAQIVELDEQYEAGKINDTEHELRRQNLVERAGSLPDDA